MLKISFDWRAAQKTRSVDLIYLQLTFIFLLLFLPQPRGLHQKTMVTTLLQLHDDIDESTDIALHPLGKGLIIFGQDPPRKNNQGSLVMNVL